MIAYLVHHSPIRSAVLASGVWGTSDGDTMGRVVVGSLCFASHREARDFGPFIR